MTHKKCVVSSKRISPHSAYAIEYLLIVTQIIHLHKIKMAARVVHSTHAPQVCRCEVRGALAIIEHQMLTVGENKTRKQRIKTTKEKEVVHPAASALNVN